MYGIQSCQSVHLFFTQTVVGKIRDMDVCTVLPAKPLRMLGRGGASWRRCHVPLLALTPCTELAVLSGIVSAGVLGLSVLKSICHSPALFTSENGR